MTPLIAINGLDREPEMTWQGMLWWVVQDGLKIHPRTSERSAAEAWNEKAMKINKATTQETAP